MKKINVLIVDDRDIIRDSLKLILKNEEQINVKGGASDGEEALKMVTENDYDVVLMDINMPNMNGVEATKRMMKLKPKIKVIANSFHLNSLYIRDMVSAGVLGFIKKGESRKNYIDAIKTVARGSVFLSDEINYKEYDKAVTSLELHS